MGNWKKEYGYTNYGIDEKTIRDGVSLILTDNNNRIINVLETCNGGPFECEDTAIDFYLNYCNIYTNGSKLSLTVHGALAEIWED